MRKVLKIATSVVLIFLVLLMFSYIYLSSIRAADIKRQEKHIDKITNEYLKYVEQGSSSFMNTNIFNMPLNDVQFLASHNSYKKKGSILGKLFVGLGDSFNEAKSLNYTNKTITEQLKSGIYSLELDIRYRSGEFEVTHVPVVDNSTTMAKLSLGLEEIELFLNNEPNSFPLIIILEIKNDYNFLDPGLKKIKKEQIAELDTLISNTFYNKLYRPSDLRGTYPNIKTRLDNDGWPLVSDLLGKVMFVIHAGSYANNYIEDVALVNQNLFISTYKDNLHVNAPFVIHNDLNTSSIKALVDDSYIVRTRIGNSNGYSEEDVLKAINSGAQILTTDYSVARADLITYLYFEEKYTIKKGED